MRFGVILESICMSFGVHGGCPIFFFSLPRVWEGIVFEAGKSTA